MLLALGIGFWLVQRSAIPEIAAAFNAFGIVAAVLGVGALSSAGLAYALSHRFGLLTTAPKE
jgi:flagellar motor component MotA